MTPFKRFFAPSIRRRILAGFLIVALLMLVLAAATLYQLNQVQTLSEQIVPDSNQIGYLQSLGLATSALDADLERFIVIRGAEYRDSVLQDLADMINALNQIQRDARIFEADEQESIQNVQDIVARLESEVNALFDVAAGSLVTDVNQRIITIYDDIEEVKELQQDLSADELAQLQETSAVQQRITSDVVTQTIVLGLIVFLIALTASMVIDRTLRPISALTETATAIAGGDLSRTAPVQSADEIGTLAQRFNQMTGQLRGLIGGLEQRVASRTRDLELAAEVGRSASQLRDVDTLLVNTVELIRSRFDLYYAQIYLADSTGRKLILRAGTGATGQELLGRSHQLPIAPGSINGISAAEKRPVIVADTASSNVFRPNPLLPDTRSEIAVPLIVGDRVVGVLDLQSAQPGALTDENLSAFEALAGQLAIAVENAALFAETEQARAEVEAQARRLTQAGWREFLDAVNRSERPGYTFDQRALVPLTESLPAASNPHALDVPIVVTGESIGRIQLQRAVDIDRPWDPADSDLVSIVASRVANQVENLRLLAQAEQYRAEAVAAVRRLTREGWETLQIDSKLAGYVYDLNEVRPVSEKSDDASVVALRHSLVVRDEPIGELAVDVEAGDDEAAEIVAAVAEQLSGHIETLRLSFQMQQALATTQKQAQREQALRQITSAVRSSNDPATIMRTAVRELGSILGRKTVIQMATAEQAVAVASNGQASDLPAGASPISVVGGKA